MPPTVTIEPNDAMDVPLIRLNTKPSRRDLRVFGALWLVFFAILGALAGLKGAHRLAWTFWAVGGVVSGLGLFAPIWLRPVYLAAIFAGYPLGLAGSFLLLVLIYYLVLTPMGLMMRLFGHDPLARRFQMDRSTYWTRREGSRPAHSYFHQH